jgi:hypothetical protein
MPVYVVITFDDAGQIEDLEILDQPPQWDLDVPTDKGPGNQVCYVGNVNGGDSVRWKTGDPA